MSDKQATIPEGTVVVLRDEQGQYYLLDGATLEAGRVRPESEAALEELLNGEVQGFGMLPPQRLPGDAQLQRQWRVAHSMRVPGGVSTFQQYGIIVVGGRY